MNIQLNGKPHIVHSTTLASLVEELRLNTRQVAIEKNREIVPRSTYGDTLLAEGDIVEIVAFVGGG